MKASGFEGESDPLSEIAPVPGQGAARPIAERGLGPPRPTGVILFRPRSERVGGRELLANALKIALGLAISAVFLYFAFRGVDLGEVVEHLRGASYPWLLGVTAVSVYSNWVRAQRWGLFFRHFRRISPSSLFRSTMIGLAANNVMPLRVGEAVRAYSISKKERIAFATSFTTVILERIFDMVTVLLLLALALFLVPIPESADAQIGGALRLLSAVTAAAIGLVVFLFFKQELMVRWVDASLGLLPSRIAEPLHHLFHAFLAGLEALTDKRQLLYLFAYSLWLWTCFIIAFWCGAKSLALDVTHHLPLFRVSLLATVLVAIFIMIPAAPGFVGTFQAGCLVALGVFGVPKEEALSFSLLTHAIQFMAVNVIGAYCFLREGISLREVQHAEEPTPEQIEQELEGLEVRPRQD